MRKLRLGVDVGGTFTDVVAIDAATRELAAKIKVPTTHAAGDGVAAGIIEGIKRLLDETSVDASRVAFIAHSTTQATNALLEGDVAKVGVLGITSRLGFLARLQQRFKPVALAPGVLFEPVFAFANSGSGEGALDALIAGGAEAIAVSEPFAVDRPRNERRLANAAAKRGVFATSGHDVSSLYGLRARTRTAAINAAILPKMVRTARMTADAVKGAAIAAPLMIMRSDGGVMDVSEVERRPILTMLSGPAAGVAGALLYENVTDGIFLEVGGTSTDCSAIRAGRPQMRPARIGGHRTMLQTIDSRTLGVAGGSMPRCDATSIVDVGPRSAHIAGCAYAAFLQASDFDGARAERFAPLGHDSADYVRLVLRDGRFATVTPTCASNLLGFVPDGDFARGDVDAARAAFVILCGEIGGTPEQHARAMLDLAARKVTQCVDELIRDYGIERDRVVLVGGGGGASAIVPFVAQAAQHEFRIARNADVISPIGVALALVRDVVERTIVDPSPQDIVRIRQEATDRAIASGASPDRVEVTVEIDAQQNRVRATASGATAMVEQASGSTTTPEHRYAIAAHLMHVAETEVQRVELTPLLDAFSTGRDTRILDERAIARMALRDATIVRCTAETFARVFSDAIESATIFGDVGRELPAVYIVHGGHIANLCGLNRLDQALALGEEEIRGRSGDEPIAILTVASAPTR